uniref:Large ribosomal subunit protein eL18 n=1 Tax=Pristionchus pacificus TaxID=54126 RepID=A0A2A6CC28_PRIPA|eukprot:PDM75581.1 rpl-18 [Pristionchus pacificus]
MGIDINHKHDRKARRTAPKSEDPYLRILVKLYKYLARRTGAKFNEIVLRRLFMSRKNRAPLSIARIARNLRKPGNENKIVVSLSPVTDDKRIFKVPKITVAALRVTDSARARILKAGGEGPRKAREAERHFGAPGVPHSHVKPFVRAKGRKFERARGRRASRGYKA